MKIPIKIAVVVNDKGEYNAAGWNTRDGREDHIIATALDGLQEQCICEKIVWITAEVELPCIETVEGTVVSETNVD